MQPRRLIAALLAVLTTAAGLAASTPATAVSGSGSGSDSGSVSGASSVPPTYANPLALDLPGGATAASCADPDVIRGDDAWYLYCTSDRASDDPSVPDIGLIPIYRSTDLTHWTYLHAALPDRPAYAATGAGMWAPDINYVHGEYRLYFAVSNTNLPGAGSAIGVATADSPAGPFTVSQTPVVEPSANPDSPANRRSTIDPELVSDHGRDYLFYGGFGGGLAARSLSADGLSTDPDSQRRIAVGDRYEGPKLVHRGG